MQTKEQLRKLPLMGGLSVEERVLVGVLSASEAISVTVDDILAIRPMARPTANQVLTRLHRKGWLRRLRRGVYAPIPLASSDGESALEDAWPLAMKLFEPCFISGWSAAEHWDLTEQVFNTIAVVTTRSQRRRDQIFGGVTFRTRVATDKHFFGSKLHWFGSHRVAIADPHRLVIDILDDPSFGGGGRQAIDIVRAYWKSRHADPAAVLEYAKRYARGTVFKRLGFTAERYGHVDDAWLQSCRDAMSAGVGNLDPAIPAKGPVISRWRLRINMPVEAP